MCVYIYSAELFHAYTYLFQICLGIGPRGS